MIAKLIAVHGVSFQLTLVLKGWNVSNLTIFKEGAQEKSTNYRPVNLMMQMGKMTAGKAEKASSGHSNIHCKEARLSTSHTAKLNICPFLPALSQCLIMLFLHIPFYVSLLVKFICSWFLIVTNVIHILTVLMRYSCSLYSL